MPPCMLMRAAHDCPNRLGTEHGWVLERRALLDEDTPEEELEE